MFKGQKVLLRPITREDIVHQWKFENDAELWFWDGGRPRPSSLEQLLAHFDHDTRNDAGNDISFAIEVDGQYIGYCGLHNVDNTARTCELSIEIGDRGSQGKGYGRDAVRVLLDYAFRHMNMNRVWLNTHSENERAMRCYKACGFVEEGRLRQHLWIDGHFVDRVIMGMLRREMPKMS
jgi:RimJ/RimL family protein N-acetyltransferase